MKHTLFFLVGLMLLIGCGSDETLAPLGFPPVISDLSYSPGGAVQGAGGGAITVTAAFNFVDLDSDIVAVQVCSDSCDGGPRVCNTGMLLGNGIADGSGTTEGRFPTTCSPGRYGGDLTVIDSLGLESNTLEGFFYLIAP